MSTQLHNRISKSTQISFRIKPAVKRSNLPLLSMLTIFATLFAVSVSTWVIFARSLGGPIGLFTQTDYVAIAISTRIVSSGEGARLYDFNVQLQEQQALRAEGYLSLGLDESRTLKYPYPYAPFIAVFWSPLAALSPLAGMALWDLLNLAAFVAGLWFLLCMLPLTRISRLLVLLGGITCFPLIVNLEQGQSSGLVMFGLGVGVALLKRGHDLPAGLALGLLLIKIQWLPVIFLVLLIKRRWWSLLGLSAAGATMLGITLGTLGTGWIPGYLDIVQRAQLWARDLVLDPWYSHSLSGGVTALIGHGTDEVVQNINNLALIAVVVLLILVWRGEWRTSTARWDGAMALTVLAAIFTNPQVNTHDLCLLALPIALGISFLQGYEHEHVDWLKRAWYGLGWIAYLAPALLLPQVFGLPVRLTTLLVALMLALLTFLLLQNRLNEENRTEPA
jgi:hypothetical protein